MDCSDSQIPRNKSLFKPTRQLFWPSCKCSVTQKPRNSNAVYHKTKNPFGAKTCMDITFQLLLYIMKVESQEDQFFCSLNFSDVMWKPPIETVTIYTTTIHSNLASPETFTKNALDLAFYLKTYFSFFGQILALLSFSAAGVQCELTFIQG